MKNLKLIFPLFLLVATTFIFSCEGEGKEYTSAYICPMHCTGSGSDQAGTCPTCEMDYVVNEKVKETGTEAPDAHDHDSHEGHSH
jgi:hypothetical protein